MAWKLESHPTGERTAVATPDELVLHLQQAGAKRVYLSRPGAFCDGVIPIIATYAFTPQMAARESGSRVAREMLHSVFEAIDDRLWFHDREWSLEWNVEPAFMDLQTDLIPLYDRGVERKYGDGFNLRNSLFAYEADRERNVDS